MYRLHRVIPVFVLFILLSCQKDNDIIAEMNDRSIIRSEFHDWLTARNISPANLYNDSEETEKQLKQMAVEELTVKSALEDKFELTLFYENIRRSIYANFLAQSYKKKLIKDIRLNEPAVELHVIKFYFLSEKDMLHNFEIVKDKLALASYIIQQLEAGADFNVLLRRYSENKFSDQWGSSGVFPVVILENEIFKKIKNLEDGEFIHEPVVSYNSVCVIKLVRRLIINNDNADNLLSKKVYDSFMDYILKSMINFIISENEKNFQTVSNIQKARFLNSNEFLFSINDKSFTTGNYRDILNLYSFLNPCVQTRNYSPDRKRADAADIFKEYFIASIADKEGISLSKEFLIQWEILQKSALAGAFKYYIFSGKSEKYNQIFQKIAASDHPLPAQHNKKDIVSLKNKWESELLSSNGFKICKDKLN